MFYSFVLKLKLVDLETNSNLIKKFQNIGLLREILGKVKGSTISSFLTKDKEFNQGRIYFIRITSIDSKEIKEITKYLYEKKIFNEKITIQNHIKIKNKFWYLLIHIIDIINTQINLNMIE